ncbi:diacylglycerol kinase family protein [Aerococcus kribbianus]|uniref:Diacylglycerol kinase family protein n=1 Tax=Aerococcus kribbianus TaxID=2999064 RepID=A0A9X3FM56_9LACT|nr:MULTISPECIES: diacylglycerol kinase family protein [unclassified Aerococcus]MCZ0716920.1 diacylglycerol kinase family protein [Aerococcus sp. YH-aer221]MCZ0725208.1 diacylglycerol kinase family protein [Aerococcus sp. YH-aer222]
MLMDSRETKEKTDKNHSFFESLSYALEGIQFAIKNERNLRFQVLAAIVASGLAYLLGVSAVEWLILILIYALVILMEFVNTIAEWTIDLVTNNSYHPIAKHVKDVAAGGVLIAALLAILVGAIIFVPKIIALF